MNKTPNKWAIIVLLAPLVLLMPLAMDIYVPAIPELIKVLNTDPPHIQITLSLFLLVFAFGQLVLGPISDQWGRIKPAIVCAIIFCIGSLAAMLASSIPQLVVCRIIQAIGSCGCFVVGFAIVRDQFDGQKSAEVFSYLNGMIAISPVMGPALGSLLDLTFGWQAEFAALAVVGALAIVALVVQKETLPLEARVPATLDVFQRYGKILMTRRYFVYALSCGVGIAYLFTFFSMSPYIILTILKLPEKTFGFYFAFMGVAYMIGSVVGAKVVVTLGNEKSLYIGNFISALGGVLLLVWYWLYGTTAFGFVVPMLPIGIGGTMSLGAGVSSALEPFKVWSGSAAALLGFIEAGVTAIVGTIAVGHGVGSTIPLGIAAIILSPGIVVLLLLTARRKALG